jgi:ligand-binding SRPBCC domain-containing protein
MEYLKTSVSLKAPLDTLFDFFLDPNNLKRISPPSLGIQIAAADVPLRVGSRVRLRMRMGLFPRTWELSVKSLKRGDRFIDWQERGPFREWRHTHLFVRDGNATTVVDMVEYEVPFGFLGVLVNSLFIRPSIESYFRYRRDRLTELFGAGRESSRRGAPRGEAAGRASQGRGRGDRAERDEGRGGARPERGDRGGRGESRRHGERGDRGPRGERSDRGGRGDRGDRSERADRAERAPRGEDRNERSLARAAERILERERQERLRDLEGAEEERTESARVVERVVDEFDAGDDAAAGGEARRRRRRRRGGRGRRGGGPGGGAADATAAAAPTSADARDEDRGARVLLPFDEPTARAADEGEEDSEARRFEGAEDDFVRRADEGDDGDDERESVHGGAERDDRGAARGERGSRGERGERRERGGRERRGGRGRRDREDRREGGPQREAPMFMTIYPPPSPAAASAASQEGGPNGASAAPALPAGLDGRNSRPDPVPPGPAGLAPRPASQWGRSPHRGHSRRPMPAAPQKEPQPEPGASPSAPAPERDESEGT